MKFDLVRNENGVAAVNWRGVIGMSLAVIIAHTVGWLAMSYLLGWYSAGGFIMLPWMLACVVGINTRRALKNPPWQNAGSGSVS